MRAERLERAKTELRRNRLTSSTGEATRLSRKMKAARNTAPQMISHNPVTAGSSRKPYITANSVHA